jgi:GNAT superfamily N-acetyltransferase
VDIRRIDPRDEQLTRRFWEVGKAADPVGRPWSSYWSWPAARAVLTAPSGSTRRLLLAAYHDGDMVGASEISLPQLDNRHLAYLELYVDPARQRRGFGSALLEAGIAAVRAEGRRTLSAEVATPLDGEDSAGLRFARSHGFTTGVVDEMKVVDLPATEGLWQDMLSDTKAEAAGYVLHGWRDVCPDEYLEGYCLLLESFNTETPTGELDVEPEHWDEARVREKEARFRRAGRHEVTTVAVAPDGSVAGVTEVMVSEHVPERGYQGATLVAPGHRGHGLGLWMKAANHTAVRRAFPACSHLLTGNADVNAHMAAVNDRLGYRAVERVLEMQREI